MICPRCKNEMDNSSTDDGERVYECICGMEISSNLDTDWITISLMFPNLDLRIFWTYNHAIFDKWIRKIKYPSHYYVEIARFPKELVPYDISEEKIKLMLTLL